MAKSKDKKRKADKAPARKPTKAAPAARKAATTRKAAPKKAAPARKPAAAKKLAGSRAPVAPRKGAGSKGAAGKAGKTAAKSGGKAANKTTAPARKAAATRKPATRAAAKPSAKAPAKAAPAGKKAAGAKPGPRVVVPDTPKRRAAHQVSSLPHIDGKTLKLIVAKLDEMRAESLNIVNQNMQTDLKPREEASDVGDDLDQASNERDREFNLIMHQRHLRRLQQVRDAFERIDDGSYGLCEGTDEPINPRRLLIMPLARYSLEYQEQQEKMLGRTVESEGYVEGDDSFSQED